MPAVHGSNPVSANAQLCLISSVDIVFSIVKESYDSTSNPYLKPDIKLLTEGYPLPGRTSCYCHINGLLDKLVSCPVELGNPEKQKSFSVRRY